MNADQSGPRDQLGRLIEWTGERCVPWTDDYQVIYEHYHRYALAAELTRGRTVVDLACGEGYGSYLLAEEASSVLGIDIDQESVRHATSVYSHPRLTFREGSILDIEAFPDQRFERVVCFEALEHVDEQITLMQVITQILEPGGILIISTPDTAIYSGELHNDNPFHTHELTRREFKALLSMHFEHVTLLGQIAIVGSSIRQEDPLKSETETLELKRAEHGWQIEPSVSKPPYLIAIASDQALPEIRGSFLLDPDMHIVREPMRRLSELQEAYSEIARRDQELSTQVAELESRIELSNSEIARRDQELSTQVAEFESRIELSNSEIESRNSEYQTAQERLSTTAERLKSSQQRVLGLSEQIAIYENAATIRLASRLAVSVDRVLPPGTPVRRLAARTVRSLLGMKGGFKRTTQ